MRHGGPAPALLVSLALGAASVGCSPPTGPAEDEIAVYDFVRDLAVAEIAVERSRLRAADPELKRRIGDGWGPVETAEDGSSHRWTLDERADLRVFVARPRDVVFVCRCDPFHWPDALPQRIGIEVGEFRSPQVEIAEAETEFPIPADAWKPGWNRLELVALRATRPSDVFDDSADVRRLALRVEAIELRGLLDPPSPGASGSSLTLPAGTSVTSYGESFGQRWALGDVETRGDARLRAYLHTPKGRRVLEPGPIDVPEGEPIAVELVAEPSSSWWRQLVGDSPSGEGESVGEVELRDAQILLPSHRMPPSAEPPAVADSGRSPKAVIVYMIDTLRADRLGAYGSERGLTPNLDALAEEAVVFTEARAQSSWTRPSVVSVLTGLYPQRHGIAHRDDGLSEDVEMLAERLYEAGFATAGIITNGNVAGKFGIAQGFELYRYLRERNQRESVHQLADSLQGWGLWWIDEQLGRQQEAGDGKPLFLYLHATDPHAPYTPQEPFASRFAAGADRSLGTLDFVRSLDARPAGAEPPDESVRDQLIALYDAEVAWTDHQLGLLFDELRRRDLWDDTLLVVVADHGEEFLDHGGWEHGNTLYDEQLRVPLLIKPPAGVGRSARVAGPAGHVDVLPTILDALGVGYDESEIDGRSLWPAITGATDSAVGAAMLGHLELSGHSMRSLVVGPWKLIEDSKRDRRQLFELSDDAAELRDLAGRKRLRAGVLGQERRRMEQALAASATSAEEVELDEETRKQLEALGYAGD